MIKAMLFLPISALTQLRQLNKLQIISSRQCVLATILTIFLIASFYSYRVFTHQGLAIHTDQPNIILITLPKSGSTYLMHMLKNNLGYQRKNISSKYDPEIQKFTNNFEWFFSTNATIAKEHFNAPSIKNLPNPIPFLSPLDASQLRQYTNKLVLHIRDPRQALLSLIYHITDDPNSEFVPAELRTWFDQQSLHGKIDWGIDNLLPPMVTWITAWLEFKELEDAKPDGLQILITEYEALIKEQNALFLEIINFYGIPQDRIAFVQPPKDAKSRYRKGNPNEWRETYSEEQKTKIAKSIPQTLLHKFNW